MCQDNYNTNENKGEHLKWEDRKVIEHLYNQQNEVLPKRELHKS
nr:hypothetical protein [Halonatronum saccharophilum]